MKFVSGKKAAEFLGCSYRTFMNWRARGILPKEAYVKLGGRTVRYDLDAIAEWIRQKQNES